MIRITQGVKALVDKAEAEVTTLSPQDVEQRIGEEGLLIVDLRDIREVQRDGKIPDAFHVPRGMLEFWIDPDSPYYQKQFEAADSLILYCNKGSRSALAAQSLQSMGVDTVAHMAGGFDRWQSEIGKVEELPKRNK